MYLLLQGESWFNKLPVFNPSINCKHSAGIKMRYTLRMAEHSKHSSQFINEIPHLLSTNYKLTSLTACGQTEGYTHLLTRSL